MNKINWFPGHMKKTLDMMKKEVKEIDVIIYMLDARAPYSSLNPSFLNIIKNKPVVFVLNKADLVNKDNLSQFVQVLSKRDRSQVLVLNSTLNNAKQKVVSALETALAQRLSYYESKGAKITLKAMIIGIPNCGKSTLSNTLAGRTKAVTGDKAGVTKSKQWIKVSPYIEVMDTPGTLWPSIQNNEIAENLAFIGSIKIEVLDNEKLGFAIIERMRKLDLEGLEKRYNIKINEEDSTIDVLDKIGESKGYKVRGGDVDYERIYLTVLNDYRYAKITNKILDKVEMLCNLK